MTADGGTGRVLPITCGRDRHEHLVADEAFEAGHAGRYVTLCGHDLLAVALAYPPGPRCWHCLAVRENCTAQRRHRWRRGTHRPRRVTRLAARLRDRARPDRAPQSLVVAPPLPSSAPVVSCGAPAQTTAGPGRVLPGAPAPPCPIHDTAIPVLPPTPEGWQR